MHIYIHIYTYIYTHIHIYIHIYIHIRTHIHTYIYTYTHIHAQRLTCITTQQRYKKTHCTKTIHPQSTTEYNNNHTYTMYR